MEFPERLAALRKERGLTQQALADQVGLAVLQVRRYEGGTSQPTLDVIRRLAIALGVSADMLVFDEKERGPSETLRYQFETVSRMSEHDQEVIRELLDAVIVRNQVAGAIERVVKQAPTKSTRRGATDKRRAAHQE
ncbi:MAG: helix-turn-helix domain-containing protein [Betaproteobacteria bacterium]|jgi:transcriptional regulator with XRE-family HTH domain